MGLKNEEVMYTLLLLFAKLHGTFTVISEKHGEKKHDYLK